MKTFDILIKINEAFNVLSVAINLAKYDYLPLSEGYREDYKFSISSIVSKCCEIDHKFGFEDREVGSACCDTAVYDARETLVHLMENRSNIRRVNSKLKTIFSFVEEVDDILRGKYL